MLYRMQSSCFCIHFIYYVVRGGCLRPTVFHYYSRQAPSIRISLNKSKTVPKRSTITRSAKAKRFVYWEDELRERTKYFFNMLLVDVQKGKLLYRCILRRSLSARFGSKRNIIGGKRYSGRHKFNTKNVESWFSWQVIYE